jgi:hypothetical protein
MLDTRRPRWAAITLGLAAVVLFLAYFAPGFAKSDDAGRQEAQCIKKRQVRFAAGRSPGGEPWHLDGSIGPNGGCERWLLDVSLSFPLPGGRDGGWEVGWGIPAGGRVPRYVTLSGQDQSAVGERVFGAIASAEARTILLHLSSGGKLVSSAKAVPKELREKYSWLRGLRYLVRFYPPGEHVVSVTVMDGHGKVIDKLHGLDGDFDPALG